MFIGKLHRSNVVLLAGLFFAATGIGFAFHRELQYALVSLIIASIIDLFVGGFMNQFQSSVAEAAFAKELKTLSSFLIYGVLPGVYLMAVTNAGAFSLIVFALYILAVGIRLLQPSGRIPRSSGQAPQRRLAARTRRLRDSGRVLSRLPAPADCLPNLPDVGLRAPSGSLRLQAEDSAPTKPMVILHGGRPSGPLHPVGIPGKFHYRLNNERLGRAT